MRKILLFFAVVALFAACHSPQHYVKYDESSAYYLNLQGRGFALPLLGEISVSPQRISFEQTFANNLAEDEVKVPFTPTAVEYMKNYTLTQAAFANNADMIVSPLIDVKTSADYTTITVKLTGYPASYTNFRNATKEDFELLRICENELNLQELAKMGIVAPPYLGGCSDLDCPMTGNKGHKVKEVTPLNVKEAKITIEK